MVQTPTTHGYIGSRATGNEVGEPTVVGPDWNGEILPQIKKVFKSDTQFSAAGLPKSALESG